MRNPATRILSAKLLTAKEAGELKTKIGLGIPKRRGFGFRPPSDQSTAEYSIEERIQDSQTIFIQVCARAYADGNLSQTHPVPPDLVRRQVRNAGGNISWLSRSPERRHLFHEAYCRLSGRRVPYEKVWKDHNPKSSATRTPSASQSEIEQRGRTRRAGTFSKRPGKHKRKRNKHVTGTVIVSKIRQ